MIVVTLGKESGFWKGRYTIDGKRFKRGLGNASKVKRKDALVAAAELQQDLNAGIGGADITLGRLLARVSESNAHLAEKTLAGYDLAGRLLLDGIGADTKASSITADVADRFIAKLRIGARTEQTIRSYTRTIKAIFSAAVKIKLIQDNPFAGQVSSVAEVDKTWAYVVVEDLSGVIEGTDRGTGALLALARLAGLRKGEAIRLQWMDVNLDDRRLTVQNQRPDGKRTTKSRRRDVPICPALHVLLENWWNDATDELDYDPQVCAGISNDNAHRKAAKAITSAGMCSYSKLFHTLRKNFGTDMVALGHPITTVADWLGNSAQVARNHYVRTEDGAFRQAAGLDTENSYRPQLRAAYGHTGEQQ